MVFGILVSPLIDASGSEVGDLLIFHDTSEVVSRFNRQLTVASGATLVLVAMLFGFLYVALRQVDQGIRAREADLAKSEHFQRKLTETSPDFIFVLDADGTIQNVNRGLPGQRVEDVIGQKAVMFVSPQERDTFDQTFRRAVDTGQLQTVELQVDLPDGRHCFLNRLNPVPFADESNAVVLIATDITKRKNAEKKLAKSLKETERMNRLMIGREMRVVEMKKEVNDLLEEMGREARFQSVE